MYLIKTNINDLKLKPGYSVLLPDLENDIINQYLIIDAFKNFPYYSTRLQYYVNTGQISPQVYNIIIENQSDEKQMYLLAEVYEINTSTIKQMIEKYNILGVNFDGSAAQVMAELNALNYYIIVKQ